MSFRAQDSIKCKKLYTGLDRRILTCYNNALYPGIAKLVSRLVWDQETVRSSRTTRTKAPRSIRSVLIKKYLESIENTNFIDRRPRKQVEKGHYLKR